VADKILGAYVEDAALVHHAVRDVAPLD